MRGVDEEFLISGINRDRKADEVVIYTPIFGSTTPINNDGFEIVVMGRIADGIERHGGGTPIPKDGYVLSYGSKIFPSGGYTYEKLAKGKSIIRVAIWVQALDVKLQNFFNKAEDIVAGVPQLIKNGKIDITWEQEKASKSFVETRHPRTAVAKLKNGKFLMITVDGRSESSGGIGLQDLAEYLLSLGATDAMNLDGGGSTTMFLDGKVVNDPSDKEGERRVSDAILVTLRRKK